jgi:hypothetical protein
MKIRLRNILAAAAVCPVALSASAPANAQYVTKGDVAAVAGALVGGGVLIGLGIYFVVHQNHSVTGCAVSAANGLQLQGDQQTWALVGGVAAIKPGERVRVSGKKQKKSAGTTRQFLVEKLAKDYGPCPASLATP